MAIKRHCEILVPILIFCSTTIFSQGIEKKSFLVESLEGSQTKVDIELNNESNKITVSLAPSDILDICDYIGNNRLEKMEVIDKKFLFISFGIFGGSGVELGETMCICVSKGYLYKALDIMSIDNEYFSKTYNKEVDAQDLYDESKKSKVTFINIQEDKKNNFKLLATEYDTVKSKHDPGTSHEIFDTLIFNFDKKNKVFYNKYILLNGSYSIVDNPNIFPPEGKQKDFKTAKYPVIESKTVGTYIFIDGIWYTINSSKKRLAREWDVCE